MSASDPEDAAHSAGRARILLVGGEDADARRIASVFPAREWQVLRARSAVQAVHAASQQGADAVVLSLPLEDVDAIAVCASLKEIPEPPILFVIDGDASGVNLAEALPRDKYPDEVLPGPVEPEKLLQELEQAIEGRRITGTEGVRASMPELLMELAESNVTGQLEIRNGEVCTAIHLREGRPVFAEGGSLDGTLGRLLLRRGDISEEDYARVIARMTEGVINSESLRMGEVLVEFGLLTAKEVFEALKLQVREKIVTCFQWDHFTFEIHEQLEDLQDWSAYECPPAEALILAGVRAYFDQGRMDPMLAAVREQAPCLVHGVTETIERFELNMQERRLLRAIDGKRTVAELEASAWLDPVATQQLVVAMILGLGIRFDGSPAQAAEAAGPRTTIEPEDFDNGPKTAPAPPRGTGAAAPVGSPGDRLTAENEANRGKQRLRDNAFAEAREHFARACTVMPDEPEYRMLEAWTEYLSSESDDLRTLAKAKARACAQRMLQTERTSARAHSILGRIAHAESDLDTADRHFRIAIRFDPNDLDANRGLQLIANRLRHRRV